MPNTVGQVNAVSPTELRPFLILFVCSRNMCRSVLAERLAAQEIGTRGLGASAAGATALVTVSSAGVATRDGLAMHSGTARALAQLGVSAEGFRTRRLTAGDVERADLVLTAGAEEQDQVVSMLPSASRRTYRLREFAWLASAGPATTSGPDPGDLVQRARLLVAETARWRGRVPGSPPGGGEIPDPVLSDLAILDCARVIEQEVRDVISILVAPPVRPSGASGDPGFVR